MNIGALELKKFVYALVAAIPLMCANGAQAGLIVDYIDFEPNEYVGWMSTFKYTHDINSDNQSGGDFDRGTAIGGDLAITIGKLSSWEVLVFIVEELDFDTGAITLGKAFSGDLEVEALAALNRDGKLDVAVRCTFFCNGIKVKDSTLTVLTETVAVPEPGTLGLLGLGLLGLGLARKVQYK